MVCDWRKEIKCFGLQGFAHNILVLIAEIFEANTFLGFEDCERINVRIAN